MRAKPMRPRIRHKSKVKQALDREDSKLLTEWWLLPENQTCCVCGVRLEQIDRERHHTRGRTRRLQNLTRWWAPMCSMDHQRVKDEPQWAMTTIIFAGTERAMFLLASGRDWMTSGPLTNLPPVTTQVSASHVDNCPRTAAAPEAPIGAEPGGETLPKSL